MEIHLESFTKITRTVCQAMSYSLHRREDAPKEKLTDQCIKIMRKNSDNMALNESSTKEPLSPPVIKKKYWKMAINSISFPNYGEKSSKEVLEKGLQKGLVSGQDHSPIDHSKLWKCIIKRSTGKRSPKRSI